MTDLNALPLDDLFARLTRDGLTDRLFQLAHAEDLGPDNLDATTSAMRLGDHRIETAIIARAPGVASGMNAIDSLLAVFAPDATCQRCIEDGASIEQGQTLAMLAGPAGEVLALERTLLNLLGRLCGVATLTQQYVEAVRGTETHILDTRKTTPGWRALEKYAVRCGGGRCHRTGLHDAVLIKDNHIALAMHDGAELSTIIRQAADRARTTGRPAFVEVEVDTLEQLEIIMAIEPGLIDIALLDNMPPGALAEAVTMRRAKAPGLLLEASGGVNLETVGAIAATGVDRISVGALTHQAVSIDIGLDTR